MKYHIKNLNQVNESGDLYTNDSNFWGDNEYTEFENLEEARAFARRCGLTDEQIDSEIERLEACPELDPEFKI